MRERLNAPCVTEGSTFYHLNVSAEPATIFSLISNKQESKSLAFVTSVEEIATSRGG